MRCTSCGGHFEYVKGEGYICDHCGAHGSEELLSGDLADMLDRANEKRDNYDFDGALHICNEILKEDGTNPEVNWCALLAKYKIIYLENDEGKMVPTFMNPATDTPLDKSVYYMRLSRRRQAEADDIEKSRLKVLYEFEKLPNYDVFISYKQHEGRSKTQVTEESAWADEIYKLLTRNNLEVFYDKISLRGNAGWEPHIYSALISSKLLVLLGSSIENITSPWVENEWKRYIALMVADRSKNIAVVAPKDKVAPEKLPSIEMRGKQMVDQNKSDWQKEILSRANKACNLANATHLLQEGNAAILKKKFGLARKKFNKTIELEPRNSAAYWGLVKCKYKAFDDYDIVKSKKKLDKIHEYKKALDYATYDEKEHYEAVRSAQIKRDVSSFSRDNYEEYKRKSKTKRGVKKFFAAVCFLLIAAIGVYSYFGITRPLKYTVEGDGAVLTGKNIFFNYVVKNLKVNTYNDLPVVEIGKNALKESRLESVVLGESVSVIGNGAFKDSKKLTSVTYSNKSLDIGDEAFKNAEKLSEVVFSEQTSDMATPYAVLRNVPSNSIRIGNSAFENCIALKTITIDGCVSIGENAFANCSKLQEIILNADDDIKIGSGAFDNVSNNLTIHIPTVSETLYSNLINDYSDIKVVTYTRDAVEECIYFISKISTVDATGLPAIEKAEALYNALTSSQKAQVTNSFLLANARVAYDVAVLIDNIGTVTLDSGDAIKTAEQAFNALTETQKSMVANIGVLTDASSVYGVMTLIKDIGTVSLGSKDAIERAETAYNALSENLKVRVTNYAVLVQARMEYNVYNLISIINSLDVITPANESTIIAAEQLYSTMNTEQRERITNYAHLVDASTALSVVMRIYNIGNVVSVDSRSVITAAEYAYTALTATQKNMVGNYVDLTDSRTALGVVELIANIDYLITYDSINAITIAEAAYAGLNTSQKSRVGNSSELTSARSVYNLVKDISELGSISLDSLNAIRSAEAAYSNLNAEAKLRVSNYSILSAARGIYNIMIDLQDISSVYLGTSSNYREFVLTSSNMYDELNNATIRDAITFITLTELTSMNVSAWVTCFPNATIRYDLTRGTNVTSFNFLPAADVTYRLVGSDEITYNLSFTSDAGSVLNIEFENFTFSSSAIPIDFSNTSTTNLTFMGKCGIIATGSGSGTIKVKDLNITLTNSADVSIRAGDGATGADGGTAITSADLTIISMGKAALTIVGGNGGAGTKGIDGNDGKSGSGASDNGKSGTVGTAGGNAGAGGIAVSASRISVDAGAATVTFIGGEGGAGGNGGRGGNGGNGHAGDIWFHYDGGNGGSGVNGMAGGRGGNGGNATVVSELFFVTSGNVTLTGGNGGRGGDGGRGGNGGNGGDPYWGSPGSGGSAGSGASGGSGGESGSSSNITLSTSSSAHVTETDGTKGDDGTKGADGTRGRNGS